MTQSLLEVCPSLDNKEHFCSFLHAHMIQYGQLIALPHYSAGVLAFFALSTLEEIKLPHEALATSQLLFPKCCAMLLLSVDFPNLVKLCPSCLQPLKGLGMETEAYQTPALSCVICG